MLRIAPLLLAALVGCQRDNPRGHPSLFSDPSEVDLAVDSPLDARPTVDVVVANVGDAATRLSQVGLVGEHADLVAVDAPIGQDLEPGGIAVIHLSLVGSSDPAEGPFAEDLELTAVGEPTEYDDPVAVTIVRVGTLVACDLDADGHLAASCGGDDCDDEDAAIGPDVPEACNGVDDNCDAIIDGSDSIDALAWYPDQDGDGVAGFEGSVSACDGPDGYLDHAEDCDDANPSINPSAIEVCDGVDQDCNGLVDDDAVDMMRFYGDSDADGYGGSRDTAVACERPAGFTDAPDDCNDREPTVHPGAAETCNRVDDDCDGSIDEDAVDALTAFLDQDRDNHGNAAIVVMTCAIQPGLAAQGDDCNDSAPAVFPGAVEVCNGVDDNCDGLVDNGAKFNTFYADADLDGYGLDSKSVLACSAPLGYATKGGDCRDNDTKVHPGAVETCDGRDEDCNGVIDDGLSASWYRDADADKFGDSTKTSSGCLPLPGFVRDGTDCNDADKTVFPGARETCDGRDQDCDGLIDDSPIDGKTFFADADGDKFGNGGVSRIACARPPNYVGDSTDCNDADPGVHPGAVEVCDGRDQNCNGLVDDGATGGGTWYRDADKDTFGNDLDVSTACSQPLGYIARGGDCDDRSPTINPNGKEVCNGRDDDCDGLGDEGGVCPCPTFNFGTSTYLVCDLTVPAVAALAACKNFGYGTSDIDSAEEDAFIDAAINTVNPSRSFWIGLNDLNVEGRHEWYSGLPVGFLDWSPGQPNDPNGQEDCVVIDASRHWSDTNCFGNNPFVCEQN